MSAINRRKALGIMGMTAASGLFGLPAIGQGRTRNNVGALRFTSHPPVLWRLNAANSRESIGSVADYLPDYQVTTIFTSAKNANERSDQNKAFLEAFSRGAADFNEALVDKTAGDKARDDMVKLIHKYVYSDRDYEKAAPSIINGAMRINAGAAMNMESLQDQLNWFKSDGLVKDSIGIDTVVDTSYVRIIGK